MNLVLVATNSSKQTSLLISHCSIGGRKIIDYLVRMIADHAGLYLTTDSLTMTQFEEVTSAVKPILAEAN